MKLVDMIGKTVKTLEVIRAEFGRTYDTYTCITFTDETKIILEGGIPYNPCPAVTEMAKAPGFFSAEDIAARVLVIEKAHRQRVADRLKEEQREYEKLKAKFG